MARDAVKVSRNLDDNALSNELYVGISDGTEQLLVNADGSLNATINNAAGASAVNIQDGGNSITIDDGAGSITVDGSVTVSATDLDIRDLSASQDNVAISDGTDTLAVNTDGSINVQGTFSNPSIIVDDSAFTVASDSVTVFGGIATSDSVDAGDAGALRMLTNRALVVALEDADGDGIAIAADGSIAVTDNGGSLTVDGTVAATQSGTWDIGTLTSITNDVNIADGGNSITVDDGGASITVDGTVAISGTVTVTATDLDIRDLSASQDNVAISDGTDTLAVNTDGSINVVTQSSAGTAIVNYSQATSLASSASSNHDYTASGGTFEPLRVEVSSESIATFEILSNGSTVGLLRTSVENPNAVFNFPEGYSIADTQVLRVTRTNDSNKSKDLDSTIIGYQN